MIDKILQVLTFLPPWRLLGAVFLLPGAEAALFIGLVVPGETAVIIGGVVAHEGRVSLWAVALAATAGAIAGDQVGYLVGRRYGSGLLQRLPERLVRSGDLERALDLLARRGVIAVALGRWVAALRALVPGLAGMSGLGRTRFTIANVFGGALWATTVAVAGYLAGASYRVMASRLGTVGEVLAALLLVALAARWWRRRTARALQDERQRDPDDRQRLGQDEAEDGDRLQSLLRFRLPGRATDEGSEDETDADSGPIADSP